MSLSKVFVFIDESEPSKHALLWAAKNVVTESTTALNIIHVVEPISTAFTPASTRFTVINASEERHHEKDEAVHVLKDARALIAPLVPEEKVHGFVLSPTGGASGVGASVVAYSNKHHADLVVLGSRGLGAVKRSVLSLVGQGSVSDQALHELECPVVILRLPDQPEAQLSDLSIAGKEVKRKVCIAVDDSHQSHQTLTWALGAIVRRTDEVHFVSVAPSVLYTPPSKVAAASITANMDAAHWDNEKQAGEKEVEGLLKAAVSSALRARIPREQLSYAVLHPKGDHSEVGETLARFVHDHKIDLLVVGSRGLGAFKRSAMSIIGLGSVSDYLAHHCSCPVLVDKAGHPAKPTAESDAAKAEV